MNLASVALLSNKQRQSIEDGSEEPTLVLTESPSTNTVLVDSKDRITGDSSSFTVSLGYQVIRSRYIQLKRVIVPKIPNITKFNNTIRIRSNLTVTSDITIPVGLYNTNSLSNVLVQQINLGFAAAGIIDTVTCQFDPITRTFLLSSVNGINLAFDSTCSFIVYGKSLAPFESQLTSVAPTSTSVRSSTAGMLYTRYITISSDILTQYSVGNSMTTSVSQPPSLIGVVNMCDLYQQADWDVTTVFGGIYKSIDMNSAPKLKTANGSRSLPRDVDISVRDMYGNYINDVMQIGSPYPIDESSITLFFELSF